MHSAMKGSSWRVSWRLDRWTRRSNLSSWSFMLFDLDQLIMLLRSSWSRETSCCEAMCFETRVSSAKKLTLECCTQPWRSLMNKMKRIGPNTVPWGTPLMMLARTDRWPSRTTHCFLSVRNEQIHVISWELNPYFCSFMSKSLWFTTSKAFA